MLILELLRAEIAERGMRSADVVDLIDETRRSNVLESLPSHRIDRLELECFHEALGLGVIVRIAAALHRPDKATFR